MGKFTEKFNEELKESQKGYERALLQTYFTAPEWRNVEMSEELGKFLSKGNAFYRFPFFKQIITFWSVFHHSYQAAKKYHTHRELWLSEYMVMNIFIGVSTTLGFAALGALSLLLSPFMQAKNETLFQKHVAEMVNDYAKFIHTVPFYNYPYGEKFNPMWQAFKNSQNRSLTDYATFFTATMEILVRSVLSAPVAWWYNQPQNQAAERIHLLVKTQDVDTLKNMDPTIEIIGKPQLNNQHHYAHITVPRYEAFSIAVNQLIENNIKIQKIAGQDRIQFKVLAKEQDFVKSNSDLLYTYNNHLNKKHFMMVDVPTRQLHSTVKLFEENNVNIKLMHDF